MKLEYKNESNVVGNFETKRCGVQVSSKMFKIFSSNIYKYPVRAVIREYCCNAVDSHKNAGTTDKYDLHIPRPLDPVFYVRDYGAGLSHTDVMETFTEYFYSTKENSNDYVGCLGLGSKSLFSIVDSFIVTSWYQGNKSVYTCFMNEFGEPCVSHVLTESSEERTGLEVRASVKDKDIPQFRAELPFVFRFMEHPNCNVEINTGSKFEINTEKYSINHFQTKESFVVMGGVAYKIEHSQLSNPMHKKVIQHGIIIYADIGSVSFNPGREELSFDKQTVQYLEQTIDFVLEDLKVELQNRCDAINSYFKARSWSLRQMGFIKDITSSLSYKGRKLSEDISFDPNNTPQCKDRNKRTKYIGITKPIYLEAQYILVRDGHVSASKEYAKRYESFVLLIKESHIDLIGLGPNDYTDSNSFVKRIEKSKQEKPKSKKYSGYIYTNTFQTTVSRNLKAVEEVPENAVYFILNRSNWSADIGSLYDLHNIFRFLKTIYDLPDIYAVKNPLPNGTHLKDWTKTAKQKKLVIIRNFEQSAHNYLLTMDNDYKKNYEKSEEIGQYSSYLVERFGIKTNELTKAKIEKLIESFPLIEHLDAYDMLEIENARKVEKVINALSHQVQ
jgi:hypothetical protein